MRTLIDCLNGLREGMALTDGKYTYDASDLVFYLEGADRRVAFDVHFIQGRAHVVELDGGGNLVRAVYWEPDPAPEAPPVQPAVAGPTEEPVQVEVPSETGGDA